MKTGKLKRLQHRRYVLLLDCVVDNIRVNDFLNKSLFTIKALCCTKLVLEPMRV